MTPPNNIITLLKECQRINWWYLQFSGYEYPGEAKNKEQLALIALAYALDLARVITQLCEDDNYDQIFEVMRERQIPEPW